MCKLPCWPCRVLTRLRPSLPCEVFDVLELQDQMRDLLKMAELCRTIESRLRSGQWPVNAVAATNSEHELLWPAACGCFSCNCQA